MATSTSYCSATFKQLSIAAGVVPQSSCSLRPIAPAVICSSSASGRLALPLPRKPMFIGRPSAACSMRWMCHGPGVQVGITRLADGFDTAVLDADVGLHDAPEIEDQRIGDDGVDDIMRRALTLAHAVEDHLAAAEFHLFAVHGVITLDLDPQRRVAEAQAVADRGAVHLSIGAPADPAHVFFSNAPITLPWNP